MEDWTLHDLRRTAATKMASLGVAIDVIELALNHQSQKLRGIAGIYNRFKCFDERKVAFQRLADHYQQLFQHLPISDPQSTLDVSLQGADGQWCHQEMPRFRVQ